MSAEKKRPGIGFWSTVIFAVLVAYPLSVGTACWISSRAGGERTVTLIYRPLTLACRLSGDGETARRSTLTQLFLSYSTWGAAKGWFWMSWDRDSWEWEEGIHGIEIPSPSTTIRLEE